MAEATGRTRRAQSLGYSGRTRNQGQQPAGGAGIILFCFFLSGATGLAYQVVWLRLLTVGAVARYPIERLDVVEIEPARWL